MLKTIGRVILPAIVAVMWLLPCRANAQQQATGRAQWTPILKGGKINVGKNKKLRMGIDLIVSMPPDRRDPKAATKKRIGASWNFNDGSSAETVCTILGDILKDALDEHLGEGHGITVKPTLDTPSPKDSIIAKGVRIIGASSGSENNSKAYWEFEGRKDGKTLPYEPKWKMGIKRHGFAPFDGLHYIGMLHVRAMGVRTGKHGPSVASSSTNILVCQGMTGPMIANALMEALVQEGWDARLNPEDECSVLFGTIPDGVKITSVVYRFEGFEGKPDIERDAYDLSLSWGPPIAPRERGNAGGGKEPR